MGLEIRDFVIIALIGVGVIVFCVIYWTGRSRRRRQLGDMPFPDEWEDIISGNVPVYKRLPENLRSQLKSRIRVFLDEKNFEGCSGLEITDEIKVTIAAQACILILNRDVDYFPKLDTILVYPHAYIAKGDSSVGNQRIRDIESARLGESWQRGTVVLAWDSVKKEIGDINDGHNVVLHEFAHQLDQESGSADGIPILGQQRSVYLAWGRVLGTEYDDLRDEVKQGIRDVMDEYGATSPAEFFAVATETFFEKTAAMKSKHPELYDALREYYKVDPLEWS